MPIARAVSCVVAALLFETSADAQNLLPNPHFDSDLAGWIETVPAATSWSSTGAEAPGFARFSSFHSQSSAALRTCVPVTPGTYYWLEISGLVFPRVPNGFFRLRTLSFPPTWTTFSSE
jgi:hypothetical protein